jgi:PAS domain S-box-containing protein
MALAAAIFAVDLWNPLPYSVGILYVLVIVAGLWVTWRPFPMVAALLALTLDAIHTAIGWDAHSPEVFVNQPLAALAFVTTAALVMRFKRLEQRARIDVQQLADLKSALDHAAIVATTDVKGRITYVNDKFCDISGYSRSELVGQDHRIINSGLHPSDFMRDLWRTIANGQVWHGEIRNKAKDGHLYWVDTTIVPFMNATGRPYQYIAIRSDITARRAAEERLAQQAALARLGQMAAVVAHEVKNPLAGIKGAIQVLMSRRKGGDDELPVMRDIVARIDTLSDLIQDLTTFARPRPPRLAVVSVRQLLDEALTTLRRDPISASLDIHVECDDGTMTADIEMMRSTLLNLLLNAAQAMHGQGRIDLVAGHHADVWTIEVRDSGPGIPPDLRDQVLEPFFTTKARGGGLGLPIAKRVAELHRGTLDVLCPDGGGTTVRVRLPGQP